MGIYRYSSAALFILLSGNALAWSEYPIKFQIRISSDVSRYGAPSDGLVVHSDDVRAIFAGDSITRNFDAAITQRNAGVSGATTDLIARSFTAEMAHGKPAYAHILAGTNDFYLHDKGRPVDTAAMLRNVDDMLTEARRRHVPVIVGTVLPMTTVHAGAALIPIYNAQLIQHVGRRATIADYYTAMVLPSGQQNSALFYDGIHPNEAGYRVMNQVLDQAVERMKQRQERRAERREQRRERRENRKRN